MYNYTENYRACPVKNIIKISGKRMFTFVKNRKDFALSVRLVLVDTNGNVILNSLTARHRSLFNRNEGSGRFLYCVMTILMVNLS